MRRRSLVWLTVVLSLAAAIAWGLRWAITSGRIHSSPATRPIANAEWTLLVAAVISLLLLITFRAMEMALGRSRAQAVRSISQLQIVAALVLVVILAAVLIGDFSTMLVSLGIVGFGLTLALQRPILALAGWATIFFGGMFREGDRIQVGDLTGDVLAITLFTTRLWEIGSADSRTPGRPSARILTVSNALFLERPVANATTDAAIVFDEFVVNVAFEADLQVAREALVKVSEQVLDAGEHERMAATYRRLTYGLSMEQHFPTKPRIFMRAQPSWMEMRLRYLVRAREFSTVQSQLTAAWTEAMAGRPELPQVYPRSQSMPVATPSRPVDR